MRGDEQILEILNDVLTAELTAVNQYFLHAKLLQNWGYLRLAAHSRHESIDEMQHAERLTDRILYFDGMPNFQRLYPLRIGENVKEILESDLQLEYVAVERLNKGVAAAVAAGDNGTRELFEAILVAEEEHVDWLETQLEAMRQVGEAAYLAEQLG